MRVTKCVNTLINISIRGLVTANSRIVHCYLFIYLFIYIFIYVYKKQKTVNLIITVFLPKGQMVYRRYPVCFVSKKIIRT